MKLRKKFRNAVGNAESEVEVKKKMYMTSMGIRNIERNKMSSIKLKKDLEELKIPPTAGCIMFDDMTE